MTRRTKAVALAVFVAVAAAIAACGEKGQKYDVNLLKNSSFEKVGKDGIPTGWKLEPFRGGEGQSEVEHGIDEAVFSDGKKSFFFRGDPGTRRWHLLSQEVPVAETTTHVRLQGWLQTDDTKMMPDQFAQCNFLLTFFDENHQRFQEMRIADKRTPLRFGTHPWIEENYQFRVPKGTRFVSVSCVLGMRGQAWFDNVSLVIPKPTQWETASTKNFLFHWLPGHPMPAGSQPAQQQIFDYIASRLNVKSDEVINYYFYPDTATIQEMMSLKGYQYVSWDDLEFHSINANENHEIVHFITDPIGRPPRAIAEGTVFWVEDDWNGKTIDDCMRVLTNALAVPKLTTLFDYNLFAMADANVTMPASASWVGFLVQRWGPDKLMAFYAAVNGLNGYEPVAAAFQKAYGLPMSEAEEAWHAVLRAKFLPRGGVR